MTTSTDDLQLGTMAACIPLIVHRSHIANELRAIHQYKLDRGGQWVDGDGDQCSSETPGEYTKNQWHA